MATPKNILQTLINFFQKKAKTKIINTTKSIFPC